MRRDVVSRGGSMCSMLSRNPSPHPEAVMHRTTGSMMTRERTWALTMIAVALFVLLSAIFGDGLFTSPLWRGDDWIASQLITYLLILAIVLAGWYQARGLPADGVPLRVENSFTPGQVNDPARWRLLMGN